MGGEHNQADYTARAAVPFDGFAECCLDKVDALLLRHLGAEVSVAESINVRATGASNSIGLLMQRSSKRDRVDVSSIYFVESSDN